MTKLLLSGFCLALLAAGWILIDRQQDVTSAKAFADQAEQVRRNTFDAVEFYSRIGLRGEVPTPEELHAWQDRNTRIDAEARRAALHLRSAATRESALRWLMTQQALRSARVSARVIAVSRVMFDYCTERQQFVAQAVRGFSLSGRMAALSECFDQQRREEDSPLNRIRAEIERLEAEEADSWARLLAIAPEIGW